MLPENLSITQQIHGLLLEMCYLEWTQFLKRRCHENIYFFARKKTFNFREADFSVMLWLFWRKKLKKNHCFLFIGLKIMAFKKGSKGFNIQAALKWKLDCFAWTENPAENNQNSLRKPLSSR